MCHAHGLECARTVDSQRKISGMNACFFVYPQRRTRESVMTATDSQCVTRASGARGEAFGLFTPLSLYIYMIVRLAGN